MTREEKNLTIDYLKKMKEEYIEGEGYEKHPLPEWYALDMAIQALERKPILDKIRAEIVDLGQRTMNDNRASGIWACIDIIDKYKSEMEGEEE